MKNLRDDCEAILITGPTASGKSALALELADRHGGVVINADSMQVYDTLRVLTARPSPEDMQAVRHELYGHVPAVAPYSTGDWLRDVNTLLPRIQREGKLPVFVGGTGLYFKALTGGLSEMPNIPDEIRGRLRRELILEGPAGLYERLKSADPSVADRLTSADGQRIVRALEVLEATGRSIAAFQEQRGPVLIHPERAHKIVVLPDRKRLHQRIDQRFAMMLEGGAVEEVEALLALSPPSDLSVMKAIGVAEIAAMVRGEIDCSHVIERGSALTRQYAKRQMTWFRNQMDETWLRYDPFAVDANQSLL